MNGRERIDRWRSDLGSTISEYAILLGGVVLVSVAFIGAFIHWIGPLMGLAPQGLTGAQLFESIAAWTRVGNSPLLPAIGLFLFGGVLLGLRAVLRRVLRTRNTAPLDAVAMAVFGAGVVIVAHPAVYGAGDLLGGTGVGSARIYAGIVVLVAFSLGIAVALASKASSGSEALLLGAMSGLAYAGLGQAVPVLSGQGLDGRSAIAVFAACLFASVGSLVASAFAVEQVESVRHRWGGS